MTSAVIKAEWLDLSDYTDLAELKAANPLVSKISRWNGSIWHLDGLGLGQTRSGSSLSFTMGVGRRKLKPGTETVAEIAEEEPARFDAAKSTKRRGGLRRKAAGHVPDLFNVIEPPLARPANEPDRPDRGAGCRDEAPSSIAGPSRDKPEPIDQEPVSGTELEEQDDLTDQFKYLAAILFIGVGGDPIYKSTTSSSFSSGCRYMADFMRRFGVPDFATLDEEHLTVFKKALRRSLANPAEASVFDDDLDPEDARRLLTTKVEDEELGVSPAFYRLRVWKHLREHRSDLARVGLSGLSFEPFPGTSPRKQAEAIATEALERIPAIPDEIALPILHAAHRLIWAPADDIIELQRRHLECHPRRDREPPTACRKQLRFVMEDFRFSEVEGETGPWREPIVLPEDEPGGGREMHARIKQIRDAAVIVILSGVGCRISECCSFKSGMKEDLPACIERKNSISGLSEHFLIHGLYTKGRRVPTATSWLAGARPRGSAEIPPVVRAVQILNDLYAPWRAEGTEATRNELIIGFAPSGLPRKPASILPISSETLRVSIRSFIVEHVKLRPAGNDAAGDEAEDRAFAVSRMGEDLTPYYESKGACIRLHQWRKTYSRFLLRVDERLLPAISRQYKHHSRAMTEGGYIPHNPEELADIDEMQINETIRFLYKRRFGREPAVGGIVGVIDESAAQLAELIGERSLDDAYGDLKAFCVSNDIRIFFADHGRCLIGVNPSAARCHNAEGKGTWKPREPNYQRRTPSTCLGCSNFAVARESGSFWADRYVSNKRRFDEAEARGQGRDFRVARERAEQAAKILKVLKMELPPV